MKNTTAVFFIIIYLLAMPFAFASNTRMLSLGTPTLFIPDPDTDLWSQNPCAALDSPDEIYNNYRYKFGRRDDDSVALDGGTKRTTEKILNLRENIPELGFIKSIKDSKLALRFYYDLNRYNNHYISYTNDSPASKSDPYPQADANTMQPQAAYAVNVGEDLALGITTAYKKFDDKREYLSTSPVSTPITSEYYIKHIYKYALWDSIAGISYRLSPKIQLALALGGGLSSNGDYQYEAERKTSTTDTRVDGDGDINQNLGHVLGQLNYNPKEDLTIPLFIKYSITQDIRNIYTAGSIAPHLLKYEMDRHYWSLEAGSGFNAIIDKERDFMVFCGISYAYYRSKESYDYDYIEDTSDFNSRLNYLTQDITLNLGTEGNITSNLMGRFGIYYNYTFTDKIYSTNHFIPVGDDMYLSGDGFDRKLGIGLGLSYSFNSNVKLEIGYDIPIFSQYNTKINGLTNDMVPYDQDERSKTKYYTASFNIAYLF